MSKIIIGSAGVRSVLLYLLPLALALVSLFAWTASASAETSFKGQYGNPTASGEAAIAASGGDSGSALTASGGGDPSSGDTGSSVATMGVLPLTGILPDTGGPLLPLFAFGAFALSFAGLLALRRLDL
jgi:hypothetical protein